MLHSIKDPTQYSIRSSYLQYRTQRKRSKALSNFTLNYELKAKRVKEQQAPGLSPNDVTYLIFPDRFCNGENDNDNENMQYRVKVDRGGLKSRHGGDLAG